MLHRYEEITQWGHDRGIYTESDAIQQLSKFHEEFVELCLAYSIYDWNLLADAIGDCVVCLVHVANFDGGPIGVDVICSMPFSDVYHAISSRLRDDYVEYRQCGEIAVFDAKGTGRVITMLSAFASHMGLDFDACVEQAWREIEHRPGRMIDGKFVKDAPGTT
jgi:hypothetical protein